MMIQFKYLHKINTIHFGTFKLFMAIEKNK